MDRWRRRVDLLASHLSARTFSLARVIQHVSKASVGQEEKCETGLNVMFSREVEQALGCGQAVVALESTIISHGIPHEANAIL